MDWLRGTFTIAVSLSVGFGCRGAGRSTLGSAPPSLPPLVPAVAQHPRPLSGTGVPPAGIAESKAAAPLARQSTRPDDEREWSSPRPDDPTEPRDPIVRVGLSRTTGSAAGGAQTIFAGSSRATNARSADDSPPVPVPERALAADNRMTLAALEQLALSHNPAIQQAAASAHKAAGMRQQVGRRPNPTVGYFGAQLGDAGTQQQGAFIEQDFVLGHKLSLNECVLDHDVQVQLWEVEAQRYRVLTDVRLRFFEALAAQRRVELTDEFHRVAEHGVRIAEERKAALEGSQPEVLQAEIQLNEVDLARRRAQIAFEGAWQELAATAGAPHLQPMWLDGTFPPATEAQDWELTYQSVIASSPELRAAYARVHRAQANLERQRAQPIPNVGVELQAGHDSGTGDQLVNLQVGVPLPVFNKNRGNIDAAYAEYCRASQDARRVELSLKARLARAAQAFDSAAAAVQRYETQIVPRARETLRLSEEAYAAGEFGFLQILIARRTYFESNLQHVHALAELAQAKAGVDGLLLTGGLSETADFTGDDSLRGQALSGQ
jgi:cobalt-zinc-cadmium efflux system outer membrane protein